MIIVLAAAATLLLDGWDNSPFKEIESNLTNGDEDGEGGGEENDGNGGDNINCEDVCSSWNITESTCPKTQDGCTHERDCGQYSDVCIEVACRPCENY
ncbi:MAG: hypothetical protein ACLFQ8_01245 [Candidatus Aenigmatarchaeota archaeon]